MLNIINKKRLNQHGLPVCHAGIDSFHLLLKKRKQQWLVKKTVMVHGLEADDLKLDSFHSLVWQEGGLKYSVLFIDSQFTLDELQKLANVIASPQ